jgi:hypothetical protein
MVLPDAVADFAVLSTKELNSRGTLIFKVTVKTYLFFTLFFPCSILGFLDALPL